MAMKKEKRLLLKLLKHLPEYVEYENGVRGHDMVHLLVNGKRHKIGVSCTSKLGPTGGSRASFRKLKKEIRRIERTPVK